MEREYILGGKNPPRAITLVNKKKVKPTGWLPCEDDIAKEEEEIPLHRKVGDQLNFPYADTMRIGEVIAVKDPTVCLIESDGDIFFERGQDITFLPISAACTHCGGFAFQCGQECPSKQRKPNKRNNTMAKKSNINISEVLAIEPGDDDNAVWVNDVVTCVVTNVKEANGKGPVKATLVNTEDNGDKITGIFWKRDYDKIAKWEGKQVSFEGGMIRSEYKPKQGPRIQQLAVQAKCEVEVIGVAADSKADLPHWGPEDRDTPVNAPKRQETGNTGNVEDDGSIDNTPVNKRIFDYFKVMAGVIKAHEEYQEKWSLPDFSPSDIKEITTGICMGYKGKFGVYRAPIFPQASAPKPEPQEQFNEGFSGGNIPFESAAPAKKPQSTERGLESWKTCAHPRRKNDEGEPLTIGEMTEADRLKYCRWAATVEDQPDGKEDKLFYANLKMLMASKGWSSPAKLLAVSLLETEGYGEAFTDEDVSRATQAELDKDLDDLDDDEALQVLGNFDAFIEEVIKAAKKPAKPSKKGKASLPD